MITTKCHCLAVLVYNKDKEYISEFVSKKSHDFGYIKDYEVIKVKINDSTTYQYFLYCLSKNNTWYYLSPNSKYHQYLGERVGKTAFVTFPKNSDLSEIKILHGDSYDTFTVEFYTSENIYVSPAYQDNIEQVNKTELSNRRYSFTTVTTVPDQYLIIKENGKYRILGIYLNEQCEPRCEELLIPIVIFKELNHHVVLQFQDNEYKVIYHQPSVSCMVNDVIAEFTNKYRIGGIVWQLNPKKNTLEKIYEGNFRAIDFNGAIIGDDGWEYKPQT